MKQLIDYKKQSKLKFFGILLVAVLIVPAFFAYAQTASDLKNKISEKTDDIEKLEAEIRQFQSQLNEIGKQKSSLAGSIKELDITKKKLAADISITEKKIDRTNLTIQGLSSQIGTKETSIGSALDSIALQIKKTNEFEQNSLVENVLSDNDFSTIWTDIDHMMTLQQKMRESIYELKQVKGELEDTRSETIEAKNELATLRSKLVDQKKIVDQNTAAKNKLLAETKNNEANYQKILADRLAKKNALEKEIQDYESQLKYILDPDSLPSGGVLAWPLDYVLITQQFGKTESSKRLYASGTHSGTDFRAAVGTPVRAMSGGVVAGVGDTDIQCRGASFGKFVLIQYDNGLASTYGHLSLTKVSNGQRVNRGDIVAYSGNTGYSTGPHLHVSLYAKDAVDLKTLPSKSCPGKILTQPIAPTTAYLDPLFYMPPTTASMFK
jgi:murein DD-endopeptidase MepM/ murein hydrolase activator NlpD